MGRRAQISGMALSLLVGCGASEPSPPHAAPRTTASAAPSAPDGPPVFVPQRVPDTLWEAIWLAGDQAVAIADPDEGLFIVDGATGDVRAHLPAGARDIAETGDPPVLYDLATKGTSFGRLSLSDGRRQVFPVPNGDPGSALGLHQRGAALHVLTTTGYTFLDAATGKVIASGPAPEGLGYSMSAFPGGQSIVLATERSLAVLDPQGKVRFELPKAPGEILDHAVSRDDRILAVLRGGEVFLHDAQTGALLSQGHRPCGSRRVIALSFAPDGRSAVSLCSIERSGSGLFPEEVHVSGLDFEAPRTLAVGEAISSFNRVRYSDDGATLLAQGNEGDALIVSFPKGERLASLEPRCAPRNAGRPCVVAWNGTLSKAVVSELTPDGSARTGPHLIGRNGAPLTPLGTFKGGPPERDPYVSRGTDGHIDSPLPEPPAARFRLGPPNYYPDVWDTVANKAIPFDPPAKEQGRLPEMNGHSLSAKQTYLVAVLTATMPSGLASTVLVWRTETGKRLLDLPARGNASYAVAPDESRIAVLARGCSYTCYDVTVFALPSGKRASSFRASSDGLSPELSGDATMLAAGSSVHDSNTGRILYSVPAEGRLLGWVQGTPNVAVLASGRLLVVEPRSRKVVRSVDEAVDIVEVRRDAKAVLLRRKGFRFAVLHLDDGHVWEVPSDPPGFLAVGFAGDHDVVHMARTASSLDAHGGFEVRESDGRVLFHHGKLVATDQGVFDGPEEAFGEGAFRMGPDILRARMAPLRELAARFHKPGLRAAFLAGEPVSPVVVSGAP